MECDAIYISHHIMKKQSIRVDLSREGVRIPFKYQLLHVSLRNDQQTKHPQVIKEGSSKPDLHGVHPLIRHPSFCDHSEPPKLTPGRCVELQFKEACY